MKQDSLEITRSDAPKRRHSRKKAALLIVCFAVFAVLLTSYALRTSTYLHARITPKLEQLGEKVGGTFSFTGIHAMGLTGIILDDVTFLPDGMTAEQALSFQSITIYPDLLGMFIGDLNASAIEANGFFAKLDFSDAPHSHRTWLTTRRDHLAASTDTLAGAVDTSSSLMPNALPEMRCVNCHVEVTHRKGDVTLEIPWQSLTFVNPAQPWQAIQLSGEKIGACMTPRLDNLSLEMTEPLCVEASSTGMAFESDAVHLDDFEIGAVDFKMMRLNAFAMKNVEFRISDEKRFAHVEDGRIDMDISDKIPRFAGHYAFDYREFELLHVRESDRLGFGIAVKTNDDTTARIFGGFDRVKKQLGVTIDSDGLNFAPLLKEASFSQKLTINALPVTGLVEIRADLMNKLFMLDAKGAVSNASVNVPVLAKEPLEAINGDVEMAVSYDVSDHTLIVDVPKAHLGKINLSGSFAHSPSFVYIDNRPDSPDTPKTDLPVSPMHVAAQLRFDGESADFLAALPKNFAPALTGYQLEGPFSGNADISFDTDNYDALQLNVALALDDVKTIAFDPRSNFDLIKTNNFLIKVNAATVPKLIGPREASWASFYDLPRETAYAFVASEDTKFFTHTGIDLKAIRASLIANLKADKVVRGGSTISQQVVKNLFLTHEKTLSRKFQEAFLTWQMEKTLSKLRILELYLNLAQWAKDTYGIRDAAKFYFQKNVRDLTLSESLFLACILPNPVIFGKQYADNRLSSSRVQKMINIATNLNAAKRIDKATLDAVVEQVKSGKVSDRPRPKILD